MESHYSSDEEKEVNNEICSYYNDAQGEIYELLNESKILYKTLSTKKEKTLFLKENIDTMEKDFEVVRPNYVNNKKRNFTCKECDSLSFQIVHLKRVIERYEK